MNFTNCTDIASSPPMLESGGPLLLAAGTVFFTVMASLCLLLCLGLACPRACAVMGETTAWRAWREVHQDGNEENIPMMDYKFPHGGFLP